MPSLFHLDAEIEAVLGATVDRETGEVSEEGLALLESLERERDSKALAVAGYIVGLECEAEAVKAQAKRLAERAARHARHADRLRAYLEGHIPRGTKLRDATVEIGWRKSTAVEVDDGATLPESLQRVTVTPDKKAIGDALKAGAEVPGCRLVERVNLVIR